MNIFDAIKTRRTVRKYTNDPVPIKLIDKLLDAAARAPSAHNTQPWNFFVINTPEEKENFVNYLNGYQKQKYFSSINILIKNSLSIMQSAATIIVICNNCQFSRKGRALGKIYHEIAYLSEIESISAAIQNMHLVSTSLGIGMAWLTMPLFLKNRIKKALQITIDPVAIVTLGYPAEKTKKVSRKSRSEISKFL